MTRFRHMLMMRFKDDVTDEQKTELLAEFARMPEVMDYIRRYEFGLDLGNLGPDGPDFGLVADFDSEEDWRRYSDDPDHQGLVGMVRERSAELTRVQYLVG
jgi:hypothetical protein